MAPSSALVFYQWRTHASHPALCRDDAQKIVGYVLVLAWSHPSSTGLDVAVRRERGFLLARAASLRSCAVCARASQSDKSAAVHAMITVTRYPAEKPHHKPTSGDSSQSSGQPRRTLKANRYASIGLRRKAPHR